MSTALAARRALPVVFATIFIDLIGIGILIPVIPQLLGNPASPHYLLPAGVSVRQGYVLLGMLTAIYPLMMFFAAPVLGQLSDRYGRRPVLALSITGTAVSYVLFAIAILRGNLPLLFLSRALDGITGGNISVAQAVIADSSTPENRAKMFGMVGAAFGLGFIIGPFLGGKLADPAVVPWFDAATPFWFAAILSALNALSVVLLLPETNEHPTRGKLTWDKSVRDISRAVSMPGLRSLFLVWFLYSGGFAFFTTFLGVYLIATFGYTEGDIGDYFAYLGLCVALVQGFVTPRIARIAGEAAVLRITLVAGGVMVLTFLLPESPGWLYVITPVFAVFNGLSMANFMGLLSRSAAREIQGEVLGINASVAALAQSVPPVLSGLIAARATPAASSAVAAVIMIGAGLTFSALHRRKPV